MEEDDWRQGWTCAQMRRGEHRGPDYIPRMPTPPIITESFFLTIPTREQWEEIKEAVDGFYEAAAPDVDAYNRARMADAEEAWHKGNCCSNRSAEAWEGPGGGRGFIYLLKAGEHYKIGRAKSPNERIKQLATQMPFPLETVHIVETDGYMAAERYLHQRFAAKRVNGEWFRLDPADVEYICSLGVPPPLAE